MKHVKSLIGAFVFFWAVTSPSFAQSTAFTYQGQLVTGGGAAQGIYDLRFTIYDSTNMPGVLIAGPITNSATAVTNGLFTTTIDFGAGVFDGNARFLEIGVRTNGGSSFTTLSPRQRITSTPYAVQSLNAATAGVAASANSVAAGNISGTIGLNHLPAILLTNGSTGISLAGTFSGTASGTFIGNGVGITNVPLGSLSSPGLFRLSFAYPTNAMTYYAGGYGGGIASGDLNGDGKRDLVAGDYITSLIVFTNNGSGTVVSDASWTVGNGPSSVTIADVNHDGLPDLVSADYYDYTLTVLTNRGGGRFGHFSTISDPYVAAPTYLTSADLNNDGYADLAVVNGDGSFAVLLNDGAGNFSGYGYYVGYPTAISLADLNGDGYLDIIEADYYSGVQVYLNNTGGYFNYLTTVSVGNYPYGVAVTDINGDSKLDFVTANFGDNALRVTTNNGAMSWSSNATVQVGHGPYVITTADVNNDGRPDIIDVDSTDNTLTVLTNNGSGRLIVNATLSMSLYANALIAPDLNGDGYPDLVSVDGYGTLSVFLNQSQVNVSAQSITATAMTATNLNFGNGGRLWGDQGGSMELGNSLMGGVFPYIDFHFGSGVAQDYNVRLVNNASNQLTLLGNLQVNGILSGNGAGLTNLTIANAALLNGTNTFTATNRFNGVVLATNAANQFVGSFTGNGAGLTNLNATNITSGTLNPAQVPNLDASKITSGTLSPTRLPADVVRNTGSGVTLNGTFNGNGSGLTNVNLYNINSQGAISLVVSSEYFTLASSPGTGIQPRSVAAADINGDGRMDLVTANPGANTLSVLTNNGNGSFGIASSPAVGNFPQSVTALDANSDGYMDLVSANTGAGTLTILTNNGSGGFATASTPGVGSSPDVVIALDVNGDGKPDLVSANYGSSSLTVLTNNGSGGFATASSPSITGFPQGLASADVNGDGRPDLISANYGANTLTVFTNSGTGGFVTAATVNVGTIPYWVAAADINGDGKADLVSVNGSVSTLTIFTNNGIGGFTAASSPGTGFVPYSVAATDANGDGRIDLVTANAGDNTLTVLTNNGTGSFTTAFTLGTGTQPESVISADLNGDGKPDLIGANYGNNTLTVLTNAIFYATAFNGNGSSLSNLNASQVTSGTLGTAQIPNLDASKITSGTISLALLSGITTNQLDATTWQLATNVNGGNAALATNVVAGIGITNAFLVNAFITNSIFAGNGAGLTNLPPTAINGTLNASQIPSLDASKITSGTLNTSQVPNLDASKITSGTIGLSQLAGITSNQLDAVTWQRATNLNGGFASLATNVVAGIGITNAVIINSTFTGNGAGLTNLNASQITSGTLALAQVPAAVVTNGESGITISGTFSGNGAGVTNVSLLGLNTLGAISETLTNWGSFATNYTPAVDPNPKFVAIADVNNDGKPDLISANDPDNSVTVLTNNGTGRFVISTTLTYYPGFNDGFQFVAANDLTGDGKPDLIAVNYYANTLTVFTNNGSGGIFTSNAMYSTDQYPVAVVVTDVNGDGKLDMTSVNSYDGTLSVFTNTGTGLFNACSTVNLGGGSFSIQPVAAVGFDVNGDGKSDLVVAERATANAVVFTNNGAGIFSTFYTISNLDFSAGNPQQLCAADVNGDGKTDLIYPSLSPQTVITLTNNGSSHFVAATTNVVSVLNHPEGVIAVDVSGDGKLDLVTINNGGGGLGSFTVVTNNGFGGFSAMFETADFPRSAFIAAADFNGDHGTDLVYGNSINDVLTIAINSVISVNASFNGSGSGLTGLNASQITSGTLSLARLPSAVLTNTATGVTLGGTFSGNGNGLTNLPLTALQILPLTNNQVGVTLSGTFSGKGGGLTNLNAANLTNTLPDARLSANVPLINGTNTLTGTNRFNGVVIATNLNSQFAGTFSGNGNALTNVATGYLTNIINGITNVNTTQKIMSWKVPVMVTSPGATLGSAEIDAQIQPPGGTAWITVADLNVAGAVTSVIQTNRNVLVFDVYPGWSYRLTNNVAGVGYTAGLDASKTNQVLFH